MGGQISSRVSDISNGVKNSDGDEGQREVDEQQESKVDNEQLQFLKSFSAAPKYPMYVLQISDLKDKGLVELPRHEDARRAGLLKEVVERDGYPGSLFVYQIDTEGCRGPAIEYDIPEDADYEFDTKERVFNRASVLSVSHRWLRPSRDPKEAHPDGADHRKFHALVAYLSEHYPDAFVWMDWFSIPQDPARRDLQEDAINSLPNYFMYSSNTLVLCDTFESLVDRERGYLSRGHCLLELVTTKLPRLDVFGKWYVPGFEKTGQWGKTVALEIFSGDTREVSWEHFSSAGSPVHGNFTVDLDRDIIRPLVDMYVLAFRTFHKCFLRPLQGCESWSDAKRLLDADGDSPLQIWNAPSEFLDPRSWCEYVLPEGYADMLAAGQAKPVDLKGALVDAVTTTVEGGADDCGEVKSEERTKQTKVSKLECRLNQRRRKEEAENKQQVAGGSCDNMRSSVTAGAGAENEEQQATEERMLREIKNEKRDKMKKQLKERQMRKLDREGAGTDVNCTDVDDSNMNTSDHNESRD